MADFLSETQTVVGSIKHNIPFILKMLGVFWSINIINWIMRYRLNYMGIYPRTIHGLLGIAFSPFLHGNFSHLIFNSFPLAILSALVLLGGYKVFYCVSITIIIIGGLGVWLFGRRALHVGASGLIMGYFGFLIVNAYLQHTFLAIVIAAVAVYYFGGLFFLLLPQDKKMSWEGHVFGFISGVASVFICPTLLTVI